MFTDFNINVIKNDIYCKPVKQYIQLSAHNLKPLKLFTVRYEISCYFIFPACL